MTGIPGLVAGSGGRRYGSGGQSLVRDSHFKYVESMSNFNGSNNGNNNFLVDSSLNGSFVTRSGDVAQGSFNPFSGTTTSYLTGWSAQFDGVSDYVDFPASANLDIGTGEFTVEFWMLSSTNTADTVLSRRLFMTDGPTGNANGNFQLTITPTSGVINVWTNTGDLNFSGTSNVTDGKWHHIAVTRDGTTVRLFVDGVQEGSATYSSAISPNSGTPRVRIGSYNGTDGDYLGLLTNLRVVIGTALYTTNFEVPTSLTAVAGTQILTFQGPSFTDASSNEFELTVNGGVRTISSGPFPLTTSWSNYFDGSGDSLTFTDSANDMDIGGRKAHFEMWVFPVTQPTAVIFGKHGGAASWSASNGFEFQFQYIGGKFILQYNTGGGGNAAIPDPAVSAVGQWYHLAVASDASNNLSFYVNGTRIGTVNSAVGKPSTRTSVYIGTDLSGNYFAGYISNVRHVSGDNSYDPTQTTITIPSSPPYRVGGTNLLTCQSQYIVDNGENNFTITKNGDVQVSTESPFAPADALSIEARTEKSLYFDGSGDYVSITDDTDFDFGSGDFTIEYWVCKYSTIANGAVVVRQLNTSGSAVSPWIVGYDSSGEYQLLLRASGAGSFTTISMGPYDLGSWEHYAVCRISNSIKVYKNGNLVSTTSYSSTLQTGSGSPIIGRMQNDGFYFNGYISNLRILKGVGLYTESFTPPTSPLTAITNTVLLCCQGTPLIDQSANNFSLTPSGNVSPSAITPFVENWSYSLDGSGDYLQVENSNDFDTNVPFTLEAWAFAKANSSNTIFFRGGGSATAWNTTNGVCYSLYAESGNLNWQFSIAGSPSSAITVACPLNQWFHVAVGYDGTTTRMWLNGVSIGTNANAYTMPTTRNIILVGANYVGSQGSSWNGYLYNLRFVKSDVYGTSNSSITIPTSPLTAISDTVLLTCQTSSLVDSGPNDFTLTRGGTVTPVLLSPFNTRVSNYFDGSGDYLQIENSNDFDTNAPFTLEAWCYTTATSATGRIWFRGGGATWNTSNGFQAILYISGGSIMWQYNVGGTPSSVLTTPYPVGKWFHVAVGYDGTTTRMWVNGISAGTNTNGYTMPTSRIYHYVGASNISGPGDYWNGYLSDVRFVKDDVYGVNNTTITVPSEPLEVIPNTKLLVCSSSRFIDESSDGFSVTPTGNVKASGFAPPYFSIPENVPGRGSAYFDGNDSLHVATSGNIECSNRDFCFECWVYPTSVASSDFYICDWGSPGTTGIIPFDHVTGELRYYLSSSAGSWNVASGVSFGKALSANVWTHVALVRNGGTITPYFNGVAGTTTSVGTTTLLSGSTTKYIGGSANGAQFFTGYISGFRFVLGTAVYTTNFTPPTSPPLPIPGTAMLLNFNSAEVYDEAAKINWQTVGSARLITSDKKYGTACLDLTANTAGSTATAYLRGTYVGDALDFRTGDFTVEFFVNFASLPASTGQSLVDAGGLNWNTGVGKWAILYTNSGTIALYTMSNIVNGWSWSPSTDTWYHVAICRAGTDVRCFINGTQLGSTLSNSQNITSTSKVVYVGTGGTDSDGADAKFDGLRITRYARYTSDFSVPDDDYPNA